MYAMTGCLRLVASFIPTGVGWSKFKPMFHHPFQSFSRGRLAGSVFGMGEIPCPGCGSYVRLIPPCFRWLDAAEIALVNQDVRFY